MAGLSADMLGFAVMDYRDQLRASWRQRKDLSGRRGTIAAARGPVSPLVAGDAGRARIGPPQRLRREVFDRFLREIETRGAAEFKEHGAMRAGVGRILDQLLAADDAAALSARERSKIEDEVVSEISGFGPLDALFADPTVSDVLVNGPGEVWVDRFGRLERTDVRFDDDEHLMRLLGRVVASHGRHLDEASPLVDVRLADGSRLHALIPPICAVPIVSIRRKRAVQFRLGELYACDTLSPEMGQLLEATVRGRLNVLISGGTASGKTTLLNVLGGFISPRERAITIEETVELYFDHPHVVSLESRLPNIEGRGEVTLRDLVRNALRMRPDRIIIGEVRGPEVFDMLQAMNTGHEGSLTTVHANSPMDALRRLESLVMMGGFELPSRAIRELLGAAFHVVVQLLRFNDGVRRMTSLTEVAFEDEGLVTRELFRFQPNGHGGGGRYVATGERPGFLHRLEGVEGLFDGAAGVEEKAG